MGENILNFNNTGTYLPPGFRFHPTDEELIAFYLLKKVLDRNFTCRAIAEIDLNKSEPWELPQKAKMGEKEWYFFSLRDRKYPTGLRTNRATEGGYWKATGKDREIYSSRTCSLLGMKKTLVFYQGRAPKGEKSNWVLHEYRLEGKLSYHYLSSNSKEEWVISRLFKKSGGVGGSGNGDGGGGMKRTGLICGGNIYSDVGSPSSTTTLPPLMDSSTYPGNYNSTAVTDHELDLEHVPCFSIAVDKTPANFNQIDTCYHGGFMMNSADQYPILTNQTGSINGNGGGGVVPAFPSLKLLQENLQLPSFFMSSMMNSNTYPVISSGTPLPYLCNGNSNNNNWVNVVQPKAEMGYMPGTELDYMWD